MSRQEGRQNESPHLRWTRYPRTYRREVMETIAGWFVAGESGSVVGLPGVGRSTLLAFLHHRRDALDAYLPPAFSLAIVPVDLNILPDYSVATLYRVILRAFYQTRSQFEESLQQTIARHYQENEAMQDPFPPQSALLDLLTLFQARGIRIVWMLNRFGKFCAIATPEMIRTLRGLRDSFKDTLCYVVGLMHEIPYLPEKAVLDPLYEILDVNVCWVGDPTLFLRPLAPSGERPRPIAGARRRRAGGRFPGGEDRTGEGSFMAGHPRRAAGGISDLGNGRRRRQRLRNWPSHSHTAGRPRQRDPRREAT